MQLLNKSKDLFKYSVLTLITLVLLICCTLWLKSSFDKGIDKFLSYHTVVTDQAQLDKGYTYYDCFSI